MSEKEQAVILANKVLENASLDPDSDLSMMCRQLLCALEVIDRLENQIGSMSYDLRE